MAVGLAEVMQDQGNDVAGYLVEDKVGDYQVAAAKQLASEPLATSQLVLVRKWSLMLHDSRTEWWVSYVLRIKLVHGVLDGGRRPGTTYLLWKCDRQYSMMNITIEVYYVYIHVFHVYSSDSWPVLVVNTVDKLQKWRGCMLEQHSHLGQIR